MPAHRMDWCSETVFCCLEDLGYEFDVWMAFCNCTSFSKAILLILLQLKMHAKPVTNDNLMLCIVVKYNRSCQVGGDFQNVHALFKLVLYSCHQQILD